MMTEIGGYLNLDYRNEPHFHDTALKLNTARNCLEYILRVKKYSKIYIPFYTCDVLLQPIKLLGIRYEFYSIDLNFDPIFDKKIAKDEAFLFTNYYGIKDKKVQELAVKYHNQLIIDNSQAYFSSPIEGIDTFYSARKFFGVPDGAYLYTDKHCCDFLEIDISIDRFNHLIERIDLDASKGYNNYQLNDASLDNQPIKEMSKLTSALLSNIDYEKCRDKRTSNWKYLHSKLTTKNKFKFYDDLDINAPMVYAFYSEDLSLKSKLIANNVYIATYWLNVLKWVDECSIEYNLVNHLLPLPIDQRYGTIEMDKILNLIL
ncbi:MAG: hypothetical protein RL662_2320 [Bacteroidota bacterium]|jgi:hypothetical protein